MSEDLRGQRFPTTHWSQIGRAGDPDPQVQREALDAWFRAYIPALRAHLVIRRRMSLERADDSLQDFIAKKILDKDLLSLADPAKGKFRTLLLTVLDRMIIDEQRKRRPAVAACGDGIPPDEIAAGQANDVFDSAWAQLVLVDTIRLMRDECRAKNQPSIWIAFVQRLLRPLVTGNAQADYKSLVQSGGFADEAAARNAFVSAKKKFLRIIHQVVGRYARSPEEVVEEVKFVRHVLANAPSIDIPPHLLAAGLESGHVDILSSIRGGDMSALSDLYPNGGGANPDAGP